MEYYLSQVHVVLPVLGVTEFRPTRSNVAPSTANPEVAQITDRASPTFRFVVTRFGVSAVAQEVDGEFTVLEGSIGRGDWIGTHRHPGYQRLHAALLSDGSLSPPDDGLALFTQDVVFASPSAAAAVVSGRAANGRTSWVDDTSGVTFGEWQSRGIQD